MPYIIIIEKNTITIRKELYTHFISNGTHLPYSCGSCFFAASFTFGCIMPSISMMISFFLRVDLHAIKVFIIKNREHTQV